MLKCDNVDTYTYICMYLHVHISYSHLYIVLINDVLTNRNAHKI